MRTIVGIDPGMNGGFAVLVDDVPTHVRVMPTREDVIDVRTLAEWLHVVRPDLVVIEACFVRPLEGMRHAARVASNWGRAIAAAEVHRIPVRVVSAQEWQRGVGANVGEGDSKARALRICLETFPHTVLTVPRARKPHDGIVDALLIAHYGDMLTRNFGPDITTTERSPDGKSSDRGNRVQVDRGGKDRASKAERAPVEGTRRADRAVQKRPRGVARADQGRRERARQGAGRVHGRRRDA
jgi:Holliday junction resolvasome RuvABC endonuclease subunit